MLEPIYLPENVIVEEEGENKATFSIYPYFPGYGPTLGNALRRVLMSSLPGAAITHIKIEGSDHEFTAFDGVREDMVSLVLNLKKIKLQSDSKKPMELVLKATGKKTVKAKDFEIPPEIKIVNENATIATLTDKNAKLEMRCTIEQGRGYIPAEARVGEQRDIGTIAIDAVFTPVERVSFKTENVRVGRETDYHKLLMTIETDGTITPKEALNQAASILKDHFEELTGDFVDKLTAERPPEIEEIAPLEEEEEKVENTLNQLQLPSRVHNALERVGITTVEQVLELSEEQIQDIPGLGEKAVKDILEVRENYVKPDNETPEEK
jgi:DNA-directed RNA polymerase subunit alpha